MITKFASIENAQVLDVKGAATRQHTASFDKLSDYDNYRTGDGYMYVRLRAISSRVNKNHDGWPTVELAGSPEIMEAHKTSSSGFIVEAGDGDKERGFRTFLGKPHFVDHHNSDPKRARGVVVDSKFRVLDPKEAAEDPYWGSKDVDPEHLPASEVELLIEVDAKAFPTLAKKVADGDIDGFSMGCDVEKSKCSHCGNIATNPDEYCSHILMKGAHHDKVSADGKKTSRKSYENCYGIHFFEISAVFEPADETALAREVRHEGAFTPYRDERGNSWATRSLPCQDCHGEGCPTCHGHGSIFMPNAGDDGAYELPNAMYGPPSSAIPHGDPAYMALEQSGIMSPSNRDLRNYGSTHTAENPLPQSFQTTAPTEVDTLRQEQICPICGSDMEGETCDVCGYVEPPKGFDNPDLDKAKQIDKEMEEGNEVTIQDGQAPQQMEQMDQGSDKQPGSMMQNEGPATKSRPTASVRSDMEWTPYVHKKVAGRINTRETPVQVVSKPVSNEPSTETVVSDQTHPVTSSATPTMQTAQQLIARAQQGDTMSQRNAQGPTPDDASADKRVDVVGVGGVMDASNESASKADAQTDVTGIGGVGVTDVEAEKTETLPSSSTDNAGFDTTKNQADSGPTSTFGDSDGTQKGVTDPVTTKTPYWTEESDWERAKKSYDEGRGDIQDIGGGTAVKGVEPVDSIGKAQDRVNVLEAVTSPSNNSGKTDTWSGTGGNKVMRQQEPVTNEQTKSQGIEAHVMRSALLARREVEAGLTTREDEFVRWAELQQQTPEELNVVEAMIDRVKTASTRVQAERTRHQGGFTKLPSLSKSAAGRGFEHLSSGEEPERQAITEDVFDSAVFMR